MAGEVLEIGDKVTKSFKKGDRVACFTHGVNAVQPEDGAFAEYAVCKGDVTFKLPDHCKLYPAGSNARAADLLSANRTDILAVQS